MSNKCKGVYAVYDKQHPHSIEGMYACEKSPWMVYSLDYVSSGEQIDKAVYCKDCSITALKAWIGESVDNPDIAFTIHRYKPSADDM